VAHRLATGCEWDDAEAQLFGVATWAYVVTNHRKTTGHRPFTRSMVVGTTDTSSVALR
jgi:hypothetical protein